MQPRDFSYLSNLKTILYDNLLGLSTFSRYEATELRDGDKGKYLGKGVSKAVKNINEKISEALIGMDPTLQLQIDHAMMDLDKTENKASARSWKLFFPLDLTLTQ